MSKSANKQHCCHYQSSDAACQQHFNDEANNKKSFYWLLCLPKPSKSIHTWQIYSKMKARCIFGLTLWHSASWFFCF